MKKVLFVFLITSFALSCQKQIDSPSIKNNLSEELTAGPPSGNYWTLMGFSSSIGRRMGMASFAIKDIGYAFGGFELTSQDFKKDLWAYDPVANTWSQKASLPTEAIGRVEPCVFVLNGKGYVVTGMLLSTFLREVWEYDPAVGRLGTWTRKADYPGLMRGGGVGFAINGKGYIATGVVKSDILQSGDPAKDLWEYDPVKDAWKQKADLPAGERFNAFCFVVNNKAYVGGGRKTSSLAFKDMWAYDPTTNTWQQKADFPGYAYQRYFNYTNGSSGFVGNGGGWDAGNYLYSKQFFRYFPTNNTWTQLADFKGYQRDFSIAFYLNGSGYAGMGHHEIYTSTNDLYKYTP